MMRSRSGTLATTEAGIFSRPGVDPAMRDRTLITTGAIGAVLAAICCMTPLLVVVFGAVGLTAWLAKGRLCADPGANPVSRAGRLRPLPQTPAPRMTDGYPTGASDIGCML